MGLRNVLVEGDPATGAPTDTAAHWHHLRRGDDVRPLAADRRHPVTFFRGRARNREVFGDLFDVVVVLDVDLATLVRRLDARSDDEFGARVTERELVLRLHRTGEDTPPDAVHVDATRPLAHVVDDVLRHATGEQE